MKPAWIHAEAEAEIKVAIAFYEDRRKGLGREFRQELESTINRIRRMPDLHATVDDRGTRKYRLRRFPYTIYYVELDDSIWIAAVAHQKQRPEYWSGRHPDDTT